MRHFFSLFTSIMLLLILCFISIKIVQSSSTGGNNNGFSGVIASNTVSSTLGITVWNVNFVGAFTIGDRVQITWTMDANDSMSGFITAVNSSIPTITVLVDTISGQTDILWSPWAFTLISTPSSTASASSGVNMPSVASSSAVAESSTVVPLLSSATSNSSAPSESSSTGINGFAGVFASNNVSSTMGLTVWNVTFIGAFAVGDRVQVTWTMDSTDFMQGIITAVDTSLSTITVNVDTISGPTGIVWSPWVFSLANSAGSSGGSQPTNPNPYGNGALHQYHEQPLIVALMMVLCIMSAMLTISY